MAFFPKKLKQYPKALPLMNGGLEMEKATDTILNSWHFPDVLEFEKKNMHTLQKQNPFVARI